MGNRARLHPQLDHIKDRADGGDIFVGDGDAAADREHVEVLAGDIGGDGKRHRLLGKPGRLELFIGCAEMSRPRMDSLPDCGANIVVT